MLLNSLDLMLNKYADNSHGIIAIGHTVPFALSNRVLIVLSYLLFQNFQNNINLP